MTLFQKIENVKFDVTPPPFCNLLFSLVLETKRESNFKLAKFLFQQYQFKILFKHSIEENFLNNNNATLPCILKSENIQRIKNLIKGITFYVFKVA